MPIHMADTPTATLHTTDAFGNPCDPSGDEPLIPVAELEVPSIEYHLGKLLYKHRAYVNALRKIVFPNQTEAGGFHRECSPDYADNTFDLVKAEARLTYMRIAHIPEGDPVLLAARSMLKSYIDALAAVDKRIDSVPGIALARTWTRCTYMLIHADSSRAQRERALVVWKERRAEILAGKIVTRRRVWH